MQIRFENMGRQFESDFSRGVSIAIPLDFSGPQPSHFGAPPATSQAMQSGRFVGDVGQGGSCNVDVVTLNAHCNGTHTETVSHIIEDRVPVTRVTPQPVVACLISVVPRKASETKDSYRPDLDVGDVVIDRDVLESTEFSAIGKLASALIVRTLPNRAEKKSMDYAVDGDPAFFSVEAIKFINDSNIQHLVVDLPSIDRMHDEGKLTNHHVFWNVDEGTKTSANPDSQKTITELAFVPDSVEDGLYLLNLQVPAFESDAAPSRPILYPLRLLSDD